MLGLFLFIFEIVFVFIFAFQFRSISMVMGEVSITTEAIVAITFLNFFLYSKHISLQFEGPNDFILMISFLLPFNVHSALAFLCNLLMTGERLLLMPTPVQACAFLAMRNNRIVTMKQLDRHQRVGARDPRVVIFQEKYSSNNYKLFAMHA